jgi:hypothetical protein
LTERLECNVNHVRQRRLARLLRLLLTIDFVCEVGVIVVKTEDWELDVIQPSFESIETLAVFGDVVAQCSSMIKKIDIILATGVRIGGGLEVASATTHENVHILAERMAVADLLCGNDRISVTVKSVSRESGGRGMVDHARHDKASLHALHFRSLEDSAYRCSIWINANHVVVCLEASGESGAGSGGVCDEIVGRVSANIAYGKLIDEDRVN